MFKSISLLFVLSHFAVNACPTGWSPSQTDANTCYSISQQPLSWVDAETFCVNNGGPGSHLTSVLSAFETNAITGNELKFTLHYRNENF
jgi:hypothetical protein